MYSLKGCGVCNVHVVYLSNIYTVAYCGEALANLSLKCTCTYIGECLIW